MTETSSLLAPPGPAPGVAAPRRFKTLIADPPWSYVYYSSVHKKTRAEDYYPTEGTDWICSLPVADIAAKDSTLLLWATNPKLPDAFRVVEAWGFEFKSMLTWAKMSRAGAPRMGMGYHARCCTEHVIVATKGEPESVCPCCGTPEPITEHLMVATKGTPGVPPGNRKPNGIFFCPIGDHSRKPEYQYEIAEGYGGPYCEIFARPRAEGLWDWRRPGWIHLGNQVDGLDMRDALRQLAAGTYAGAGGGSREPGSEMQEVLP